MNKARKVRPVMPPMVAKTITAKFLWARDAETGGGGS